VPPDEPKVNTSPQGGGWEGCATRSNPYATALSVKAREARAVRGPDFNEMGQYAQTDGKRAARRPPLIF